MNDSMDWLIGHRTKVDMAGKIVQQPELFLFNRVSGQEINLSHLLIGATIEMSAQGSFLNLRVLPPITFENQKPVDIIRPQDGFGTKRN
jgi:hypothetical protein